MHIARSLSVLYWIHMGTATIHTICITKHQHETRSDEKTQFFLQFVAGCHALHTACHSFKGQTFHCGGWTCFFCRTWAAIRSRSLRPWTVSLRPPSAVFSISFSCSRDCSALRATPPAPRQKCDGHTPFRWRPAMMFTFMDNGLLTRFLITSKIIHGNILVSFISLYMLFSKLLVLSLK